MHWIYKIFGTPWDSKLSYRLGLDSQPFSIEVSKKSLKLLYLRDTIIEFKRKDLSSDSRTLINQIQSRVNEKLDPELKFSFDISSIDSRLKDL